MGLVSIIIPVYNGEQYLEESILSAQNQSYENKEIIVVDDGSTDHSYSIAKKHESSIVRVLRQLSKGAGAARNLALSLASGEYVQFLDADDKLHPDKIRHQIKSLEETPNKVAVGQTFRFSVSPITDESPSVDKWCLNSTDDPVDFFINMWGGYGGPVGMVQTNAWLVPMALIKSYGGWDESLSLDDDGEFFARIILNSDGIVYSPEAYNYYRKSIKATNLASQKKKGHFESGLKATNLKAEYLLTKSTSQQAKTALAKLYMLVATNSFMYHKEVSRDAELKALNLSNTPDVPKLGGQLTEMIKKAIGWKNTLRLKQLL